MGTSLPIQPPRLRRGAVIGLIAPASPPVPAHIEAGVGYLEGLGYRVKLGAHIGRRHGCLAGTDAERIADLNGMLRDTQVDAIFALRGGYGCPRLRPQVDYAAARRSPKIVAGYSDLTALQLALLRRSGLVTFSAPMPAVEFAAGVDPFTEEDFWAALTSRAAHRMLPLPADQPARTLRPGVTEGRLIGGCLSLLASNLGTSFLPSLRGALLFLEDVHEEPPRLDRLFSQLRNGGVLRRLAGLLLGQFTDRGTGTGAPAHLPWPEMLGEVLAEVRGPALDNLPYGHVASRWTLPLGVRARLDATRKRVTLLEPTVC
jgi:muramoyltetrapeptide carboxypeptidase